MFQKTTLCEVENSQYGLFANQDIRRAESICFMDKDIYNSLLKDNFLSDFGDMLAYVRYRYIRHSDKPNLDIVLLYNTISIMALENIERDTELTLNYNRWRTENEYGI